MSFLSRMQMTYPFRITYQSTIVLTSKPQISNNFQHRSIQTQECLETQDVKSIDEIPSPPKQLLLGHLGLISKNAKCQHKFHEDLRKQYGNIISLSIPGMKMVAVYGPEEGKSMYANEGKYPIIGGFEVSEFFR